MAIKVNGTTVIDDSRNLVNIVSGAGSSTTLADVGTYAFCRTGPNFGQFLAGTTTAGSNLIYGDRSGNAQGSPAVGTWQCMGHTSSSDLETLYVRIS